jgi:REP element-mobilizing transposase RayT
MEPECIYHVFNRAVGNDILFRFSTDYSDWLNGMMEYLVPISEIYAFNLLPNHYHLLLKLKPFIDHKKFSREINRFQSQYARQYNRFYNRKGGLFIRPFGRKQVKTDSQLAWIIWYIHRNPLHHNITNDWENYQYSSFLHYTKTSSDLVTTPFVIDFFGGFENMYKHHLLQAEEFKQQYSCLIRE